MLDRMSLISFLGESQFMKHSRSLIQDLCKLWSIWQFLQKSTDLRLKWPDLQKGNQLRYSLWSFDFRYEWFLLPLLTKSLQTELSLFKYVWVICRKEGRLIWLLRIMSIWNFKNSQISVCNWVILLFYQCTILIVPLKVVQYLFSFKTHFSL